MKKIRKGDVVVMFTKLGYGELGIVKELSFGVNPLPLIEYSVKGIMYEAYFSNDSDERFEVIDHIDETPEPRVGDVVVLHTTYHYGELGIITQTGDNEFTSTPTCHVYTDVNSFGRYSSNEFEVIDHIDDTPEPRVGDVVVLTSDYFGGSLYGDLGVVLEVLGSTIAVIKYHNGVGNFPYEHFEVIDNIDETPDPIDLIDESLSDQLAERATSILESKYQEATEAICKEEDSKEAIRRFEENGYEYWLQQLNDKLCLMKQCKHCKSCKPQEVKMLDKEAK
jgi:hypothetical protein